MPHAVIEGGLTPRSVWERFEPVFERRGDDVLRVDRAFLDAEGRCVLLQTLVASGGLKQEFFIRIARRRDGALTVRLEPLTDPEKTEGVQNALAVVAGRLLRLAPGLRLVSSNLPGLSPDT